MMSKNGARGSSTVAGVRLEERDEGKEVGEKHGLIINEMNPVWDDLKDNCNGQR